MAVVADGWLAAVADGWLAAVADGWLRLDGNAWKATLVLCCLLFVRLSCWAYRCL